MNTRARLLGLFWRGVLAFSTEAVGALQRLQVAIGDDAAPDVEHAEPYGLATRPPAGAHVFLAHLGGDQAAPVALAVSSPTARPSGLTVGDVVLYDATGKQIVLSSGGIKLGATASKGVARRTDAVSVTIPIGTVCVGVSAGAAVMNAAPISLSGTITGGSAVVKAVD